MTPYRQPHSLRAFLGSLGSMVLFTVLTGWVLVVANGYTVNPKSGSVRQTAAITAAGTPTTAHVTLDAVVVGDKLPLTLRGLDAGRHTVRVSKDGYHDWQTAVTLGPGEAARFDRVALFRQTPELIRATPIDPERTPFVTVEPTFEVVGGELYELSQGGRRLVTRFSQPISAAHAAVDRTHLFLQLGASVYVTERDGSNTTKLLDLADDTPVFLATNERLTELTIEDATTRTVWRIQ